jgi:transcriptional regulator with XRE-family HTH domain
LIFYKKLDFFFDFQYYKNMKEIGNRLKRIRKELDISQGKFAERLKIAQGTYSAIENGKEPLTERNIKLIGLEFGVNIDWLQNGGDGPIFRSLELTPDEKDLLEIYDKLTPKGQKEVRDYAAERLELQKFRKEQERAWNEGIGQNAPGGVTRPLEASQEAEKGINPIHNKDRG